MSEKLYVKHPLFPMAGIAVSVFTFAFGLAMAKSSGVFFFLGGIWLLLALFGYLRPCLAVLPAAAPWDSGFSLETAKRNCSSVSA
mgnify:CR=1 FL=1